MEIVDAAPNLDEVELVFGGFRLHLRRNDSNPGALRQGTQPLQPAPAAVAAVPRVVPTVIQDQLPEGVVAVRSPMLGTFYRAPSPGEKPFVEVGTRVRADDTDCLIEVMKLFSSMRAGVDGTVVEILAQNGSLVEYDQPVVLIAADTPA